MVQNRGLQEDMSESAQDNLEHLKGVGEKREVDNMEAYDPSYRVGSENNFSRDFGASVAKTAPRRGENIRDMLPDVVKDLVEPEVAGGVSPRGDGSFTNAVHKLPPVGTQRDPQFIVNSPANRINTSQIGLGVSAQRIVYASDSRLSVIIVNRDTVNALFIGQNSAVNANTGFVIDPGASMTMAINCEMWGISPAGAVVAVIEFLK